MNILRWKQLRRLVVLPACAVAGVSTAFAQAAAPVDAATLARYDTNGNGQLDAAELARKNADEAAAAQAPSAPAPASQENVVELSPFQVDASGDIGYYAENTLAGSRLNTNVGDLAASITVVTKQQLEDTGALDINDVFLYEANTEGAATYTPTAINRGVVSDQIGGYSGDDGTPFGIATANRVRGLGSVDTAQNNYPTIARMPFDAYNTNSVEISRGPNSMLFGTGSPSGIVNQSTSEAVIGQEKTSVSVRVASFGARRGSLSTNIPLGDKFALYAAALYDERGYQRKPSYDVYRRQYVAATFQPWKNTKLTASYENYDNRNSRPNFNTPADFITPWLEAGRPGWNPVTQQITFMDTGVTTAPYLISTLDPRYVAGVTPVGDGQLSGTTSPFFIPGITVGTRNTQFFDANGNLVLYTAGSATAGGSAPALPAAGARTAEEWLIASRRLTQSRAPIAPRPPASSGATDYQNWYQVGVTNQALYDWEEYNISGANYGIQEGKTMNVELQQMILPDLNFSLGWFRQELDEWNHYGLGQANQTPRIYIDTNTHNLDGTENPYFGSPYVLDWQADSFFRPEINDNVRAMLAYEKDFSKNEGWSRWLGRHRFLGLGSRQDTWTNNLRYRLSSQGGDPRFLPAQASDGRPFSWAANAGNIQRAYYLGQNDQGIVQFGAQGTATPGFGGPDSASLRFYDWNTRNFSEVEMEQGANLFYAGGNYGVTDKSVKSKNFAWQAYLWKDRIIPTLGWREDEVSISSYNGRDADGSALTTEDLYDGGFGIPGFWNNLGDPYEVTGRTKTRGVVIRPFRGWSGIDRRVNNGSVFAELISNLSFHYNESDNFNAPSSAKVDFFGNLLPTPSGTGKDYGFGGSLFNNKLSFRVNWYEANNKNAPANAAGTAIARAQRIDTSAGRTWARYVTRIRNGQDPTDEFFDDDTVNPFTEAMEEQASQLLWGEFAKGDYDWPDPADYNGSISGTESNSSEGMEISLIYNPKRNWNIKLTVGQQDAKYSDSVGELQAWIKYRKPQWEALAAPDLDYEITKFNGNKLYLGKFWSGYGFGGDANSNTTGATSTPSSTYTGIFESQYFPLIALQDTSTPSLREWSSSLITNYSFQQGRLKGFAIGGSLRWQDKAVGGYYGLEDPSTYSRPNPTTINITFPDLNRPIYLPTETNVDLWASYTTRIFDDKVRMKLQLNVRDAFENGGLQTILYQADGSPAQFRIKDPRQFILSATFDF